MKSPSATISAVSALDVLNYLGDEVSAHSIEPDTNPREVFARDVSSYDVAGTASLVFTTRSDMTPSGKPSIWIGPHDNIGTQAEEKASVVVFCKTPKAAWAKVVWKYFLQLIERAAAFPFVNHGAQVAPSADIGSEGLGVAYDSRGCQVKIPHIGRVLLEKDVSVGAMSVIHRGVLRWTFIGEGTQIGSLVNVGHGAHIGRECLIAPMTTIGGSAHIGDRSTIWQGVKIGSKVKVGEGSVLGMGSVVLRDVPPGETWAGVPARFIKRNDA